MASKRVGIVGASGETGGSIVDALLDSGRFNIVALTRPSSLGKPANKALEDRGIELRPLDLATSTHDSIVATIQDLDIIISAIGPWDQLQQIPLATAAKAAGVKRFLPCAFLPCIPVGGVHVLRDEKEVIYNHIKRLALPYTIVDVGWWYQLSVPRLPSGKIDYAITMPAGNIPGNGNVESALTDLRDIGRYVEKIVLDERTWNRSVFVYNDVLTQNGIYDMLERLSGEDVPRAYDSLETLQSRVTIPKTGERPDWPTIVSQYQISWGIRGDNTPEYAKYLGYLTSKDLYPEMAYVGFKEYVKECFEDRAKTPHAELKAGIAATMSS